MTPFQLVHGRTVTTMLDAMLPHVPADDGNDDAQLISQRAGGARQLARIKIHDQQRVDARRSNLRRRDVHFQPGDRVWVWTPIRRRGLSEKLLMKRYFGPYKVLRRLGDLNYEVMPDGTRTSSRRPPRPQVVHVVRMKPYYARLDCEPYVFQITV
ncbi:DDE-type integrase/transposase/recombinase [Ixodes scapularis]